jgi:hypothetical protein
MNNEKSSNEEKGNGVLPCDSGCCSTSNNIDKIYLLNSNDCVFENGIMVRMKKKYGKFNRIVHVFDRNNS